MYIYTTGQWLLLFFFYCFCGWVWESCYVSACKHRWVNRGFLHGPFLPIYGSGAIIVLFVTLPVKNNLILVWIFGMLAATLLEYVTGAVMERLFKVRYWDYSTHKIQLNGYICLSSSIAWGFFSVMLIKYLHPPVDRLLERVPGWIVDPLSLVLVIILTIDVVKSTQAALDLKEILIKLTEENAELKRLTKRAEVVATFAEEDLKKFRDKTEFNKLLVETYIEESLEEKHEEMKQNRARRRARFENAICKVIDVKMSILDEIADTAEKSLAYYADFQQLTEDKKQELNEVLEKVWEFKHRIHDRRMKKYRTAMRILRANPSARTKDFDEVMSILRKIEKEK